MSLNTTSLAQTGNPRVECCAFVEQQWSQTEQRKSLICTKRGRMREGNSWRALLGPTENLSGTCLLKLGSMQELRESTSGQFVIGVHSWTRKGKKLNEGRFPSPLLLRYTLCILCLTGVFLSEVTLHGPDRSSPKGRASWPIILS